MALSRLYSLDRCSLTRRTPSRGPYYRAPKALLPSYAGHGWSPARLPSSHRNQRSVTVAFQADSNAKVRATDGSVDTTSGVPVTFKLEYATRPGEILKLVGASDVFGRWDPRAAPSMSWGEGNVWVLQLPLPAGDYALKGIVCTEADGTVLRWEDGPDRLVQVPSTNSPLSAHCHWGLPHSTKLEPLLQPEGKSSNEATDFVQPSTSMLGSSTQEGVDTCPDSPIASIADPSQPPALTPKVSMPSVEIPEALSKDAPTAERLAQVPVPAALAPSLEQGSLVALGRTEAPQFTSMDHDISSSSSLDEDTSSSSPVAAAAVAATAADEGKDSTIEGETSTTAEERGAMAPRGLRGLKHLFSLWFNGGKGTSP